LPTNGTNGTNGIDHSESAKNDEEGIFSSPAFVKRARTSYGSLFELDPFAEEDGTIAGKGRKRTRLSSVWRYTSRSPTPEREATPVEKVIDEPIPTPPRPIMMDEGCQTIEVDMDDAAEVLASFARQSVNIGSVPYQIANTIPELDAQLLSSSMPPPMTPIPISQHDSLSVAVENFPRSPRLQPLSSDDLPLVSPLISRGLGFSLSRPILSLPPLDGEGSRSQVDLGLAAGREDLYNASSQTTREGSLTAGFQTVQSTDPENNNGNSLKDVAEDHFMAQELYDQLNQTTSILHSDNKKLATDERFYVEDETNSNDYEQDGSPNSSAHIPAHTQYPDLDDLSQQPSVPLWGNESSNATYLDYRPEQAEYEAPASAPLSRSVSGQSQDQAVDLTEDSDDDSPSEQETDADGDNDDEVSNDEDISEDDEGQEMLGDRRSAVPNHRVIEERASENRNLNRSQDLAARDHDMEASGNESYDGPDNDNVDLYYGGRSNYFEDSEEERYHNPDVDQDDNYLDRDGNVISGPGVLQGDDSEEDYESEEGSYDDEDDEMDREESPERPVQPSAPPVFIDLLSSDDEEEVPKPSSVKSSSPQMQPDGTRASPSGSEEEQSESELDTTKTRVSTYDGANDEDKPSYDQESESMGDSSDEASLPDGDEMHNNDPPSNDVQMTFPPPGEPQIRDVVVMEEHIEVVVQTETIIINQNMEKSTLLDEPSNLKLTAVDSVEDSKPQPEQSSPDRKTTTEVESPMLAQVNEPAIPMVVIEQEPEPQQLSPDHETTSDDVESSATVKVNNQVVPMVVIEQEPSARSPPDIEDRQDDDMKDSVEGAFTNLPAVENVEGSEREPEQSSPDRKTTTGKVAPSTTTEVNEPVLPMVVIEQEPLAQNPPITEDKKDEVDMEESVEAAPGDSEVTDAMDVDEADVTSLETNQGRIDKITPKVEEATIEETATQPADETQEEDFPYPETESIEEPSDDHAEETIGETLEEEFAEIVAEAVEEAVEEVNEAHDHSKSYSDNDNDVQSTTPHKILKALGDGRETPHESQSFDRRYSSHSSAASTQMKNDSPTSDIHELHNPHFTRSKGPALEVAKRHLSRRSHGLDGATDDENVLKLSTPTPRTGNANQLPTPDDTQVSQTIPSVGSSFTTAQGSPNAVTESQNENARPVSQPKSAESHDEDISQSSSLWVSRRRGKMATIDTIGEKPLAAASGEVTPKRTEAPKHAASSPKSTTTRGESEMSPDAAENTHVSPRRSHRRARSTTSTADVRDLRSRAVSVVASIKENIRPQTPAKSTQTTNTGNDQIPASFPTVVLDRRTSLPGHDASVELALSSLESPSKPHDLRAAPSADVKVKLNLSRHLRTKLSEFTALKVLRFHLNQKLDVLAVATTTPPEVQRAKGGPRHYQIFFNITDPSIAPSAVIQVQISRPYKAALPIIQAGEGILLRGFRVASISKGFALQSDQTGASSWAVFKAGDEIDVKGPPVEYGDEETDHMSQLRQWYGTLDSTAMAKINRANADKGQGSPAGKS
jgi:hypothetical protein